MPVCPDVGIHLAGTSRRMGSRDLVSADDFGDVQRYVGVTGSRWTWTQRSRPRPWRGFRNDRSPRPSINRQVWEKAAYMSEDRTTGLVEGVVATPAAIAVPALRGRRRSVRTLGRERAGRTARNGGDAYARSGEAGAFRSKDFAQARQK